MNDFDWDVAQKKRVASGAYHKKNGSKSRGCSLPSDTLTNAQWKRRNGEVKEYNLSKPMPWATFKSMPHELQKTYVTNLIEKYGATTTMLSGMLGVSMEYLWRYFKTNGIHASGRRLSVEQTLHRDKAWSAFLCGESEPSAPSAVEDAPVMGAREEKTLELSQVEASFEGEFDPNAFFQWFSKFPVPDGKVRIHISVSAVSE